MRARRRTVTDALPDEVGTHEGLAYALFLPAGTPHGAVVVLHGAGSQKENHLDTARVLQSHGFAALVPDQRGHGASPGALDGRALEDVAALGALARERAGGAPLALRGSSMGGWMALCAARPAGAAAVVAICPASSEGLRRGVAERRFTFAADVPALEALLGGVSELDAAAGLAADDVPLLLLHAEGDEVVPVEHSREVHAVAVEAGVRSRLVVVPGGTHRTAQHDPELQALTVRWLKRELGGR
ncbi:S9 family peptidase [Conexibacter sp. SYSU D00693]|uniref:alpha/beta hydrolase family protein n=1 Tax=Conexibacter sp. SYSU D00693 TaxID=2812560 RepID=UPI00196A4F09|nr:alpha/beta fold hydrolase [Conexibacter sp. SYSU D00693]